MQSFIAIAISSAPVWKSKYERRSVARQLLCVWVCVCLNDVVVDAWLFCCAVEMPYRRRQRSIFAPRISLFERFYAILDVVCRHIVSLGRSIVGKIGEQVERETRLTSISIFHNWK